MLGIILLSIFVIGIGIGIFMFYRNNKSKPTNVPEKPETPGQPDIPEIPDQPEPDHKPEPIECSVETHRLQGITITSKTTEDRIIVGTYDYNDKCDCKWSVVGVSAGEDFLSDFLFENGEIKARVIKENLKDERTTRYTTKHIGKSGEREDYFDVTQEAGYDEKFESYFNKFSEYINTERDTDLYNYIHEIYKEGCAQFNNKSLNKLPMLYVEKNFPNIFNIYGIEENNEASFETMIGWSMALALAELLPLKRTAICKIGYEMGGYDKYTNIYGWKFKSDPNVARLVGSAIYVTLRGILNPNINELREFVGGSKFNKTLEKLADGKRENVGEEDFFIDFREFMPTAPGPYAKGYKNRPDETYPNESKEENKNLTLDAEIHEFIVNNYNLDNEEYFQETVQAIADKEADPHHLYGDNITYNQYSFHPVFGIDTIGKRLDPESTLAKFSYISITSSSSSRGILQSSKVDPKQYGRMRPGCSWEKEATKHSTTDDRYNVLCNFDIEDNDGCETGYYNKSGKWVYPDEIKSAEEFEEYFKKELWANSYPSGHSAGIWGAAMVLMELMPERADRIMKAANTFAIHRTIARYHWTSDTINGRVLGSAQNAISHASSDYEDLLGISRDELKNM